jgi:hypothetical protein
MAHSQAVDRGDDIQIWRVAANIFNEQSPTADKGWSYSLGVGQGIITPRQKKLTFYKILYRSSDLDGFFRLT